MRKIKIYNELIYIIAMLTLTLAVAMAAAADFGVSMIVAPAYIISLKFTFFTFGQWDYIIQGVIFIVFCCIIKRVRLIYLVSFVTCVIYGTVLDMWRIVIPVLNPDVIAAGSMQLSVRIALFIASMLLTAFAVALFFRTYIYPQVCDFFVVGVAKSKGINQTRLKRCYDGVCLLVSCLLTLLFFRGFVGIGVGTIIVTLFNGLLIGGFGKLIDRFFAFPPIFPKVAEKFSY